MLKFDNELDKVTRVEIPFESYWRPLWKSLECSKPYENLKRISRFEPYESIAAEWGLALVYAQMSQYITPKRGEALRSLAAEIQEVLWLSNYCRNVLHACEEKVYINNFQLLKELIFDMQEQWFGSRVLPQFILLSGVERDLTIGIKNKLEAQIKTFENEYLKVSEHILNDTILLERLRDLMVINPKVINAFEWGGIAAISAGVDWDSPKNYGLYSNLEPFVYRGPKKSDIESRFCCAIQKIAYHLKNIKSLLIDVPSGQYRLDHQDVYESPNGYFIAKVNAPSGPMYVSYICKKIYISTPSIRLKPFLSGMLEGVEVEDLDLAFASLGLSVEQGALA